MAENRREDQKLWLILFQLKGIRSRLNFMALQRWLFVTLALVIGAGAVILGSALLLSPLAFLVIGAITALVAAAVLMREARSGWRRRVDPARAAAFADQRANLKGRLTTVLAMAGAPKQSPLWPYLIEDTYTLRSDFEPARIEPRWLSRSILALLAVCAAALLLIRFSAIHRARPQVAMGHGAGQITADIGNLEVEPADPALEPNAEVYADPATLHALEQKLGKSQSERDAGGVSRWMNKARNLASNLQGALTGQKSSNEDPMHIRLTNRNHGAGAADQSAQSDSSRSDSSHSLAQSPAGRGQKGATQQHQPSDTRPGDQADQLAQNNPGFAGQPGPNPAQSGDSDSPGANADSGSGGGSSRGSGTDPEHLFGPPAAQDLGSNSFKITIDAEPSDESSSAGAPAYIPPKVHVSLNSTQLPDEPLARTSIPADDELTIKRVFER